MSELNIIVKNKRTGEVVDLPLHQFKIKFQKELQQALISYSANERQKDLIKPLGFWKDIGCYKSDFYFDLRWNFNNYANSEWYIEHIY